MILYFLALLLMTLLGSAASLFLKKASGFSDLASLIKNINLYVGGLLYVASAVLNIWVLRYLEYSVVLPLTSLTYIWTMLLSYLILKEKISVKMIMGIGFIIIGSVLVSFPWCLLFCISCLVVFFYFGFI